MKKNVHGETHVHGKQRHGRDNVYIQGLPGRSKTAPLTCPASASQRSTPTPQGAPAPPAGQQPKQKRGTELPGTPSSAARRLLKDTAATAPPPRSSCPRLPAAAKEALINHLSRTRLKAPGRQLTGTKRRPEADRPPPARSHQGTQCKLQCNATPRIAVHHHKENVRTMNGSHSRTSHWSLCFPSSTRDGFRHLLSSIGQGAPRTSPSGTRIRPVRIRF